MSSVALGASQSSPTIPYISKASYSSGTGCMARNSAVRFRCLAHVLHIGLRDVVFCVRVLDDLAEEVIRQCFCESAVLHFCHRQKLFFKNRYGRNHLTCSIEYNLTQAVEKHKNAKNQQVRFTNVKYCLRLQIFYTVVSKARAILMPVVIG